METLSQKLKKATIDRLLRNQQIVNEPFLVNSGKSYSRRELADEIENETNFGISTLANLIILAADILNREKNIG